MGSLKRVAALCVLATFAVMAAGAQSGIRDFGMYATDSLRLEKCYRAWKVDLMDYPHARVRLHFCKVSAWQGEFEMREGQQMAWQDLPVQVRRPAAVDPSRRPPRAPPGCLLRATRRVVVRARRCRAGSLAVRPRASR